MLSIEETRKSLPDEYKNMPDEEVRKIRDEMDTLADLLLDIYFDKEKEEKEVFEKLLEEIKPHFKLNVDGDHGISHWRRVKRIGLHLAAGTDADWRVITLFSALHDSCRQNEHDDRGHGERAAILAVELHRKGLLLAEDKQFELLVTACRNHSDRDFKTDDLTIQTCLNSDRLDLYRLNEVPDDKFLFGDKAKSRGTRDFVLKLLGK